MNRTPVNERSTGVDTLAPAFPCTYPWNVRSNGWWTPYRRWMITAGAVVLLTGVSWALAIRAVHSLLDAAFRERSLAYVESFATSASPWLDPLQPAFLQSAARLMLIGSVQYVQIVWNGDLLLDERVESSMAFNLDPANPNTAPGIQDTQFSGAAVLDIIVPATVESDMHDAYVRIGVSAVSVSRESRAVALWAGALGVGVDLLLLALISWLSGIRPWAARRPAREDAVAPIETRTIGDLAIDPRACRVTFMTRPVRLTPKQYALIAFLAQEPDRVFADRDIVAGVWPSSEYADAKDVKQYVYLVRRRLASVHPDGRRVIETVPGFGYRLVSRVHDEKKTDG